MKQAKHKSFRDSFSDFVRRLEKEGKAGSYISRFKKVLLSWLGYNNLDVKLKVNISREWDTPTIADERVPTKEELAKIIRKASTRGRVSIALMAFNGLRPESLGDFKGTDGIRLGDFKEAKITAHSMEFEKIPSMLVIRKNLSKGRHHYFTFVTEETVIYIREYLEERVKAGEELSEQTNLLQFDARGSRKNAFLRTSLVTRDIREAMRAGQFSWRPYVLRAYADTAFDIAESKNLISHPWRQFFMGHKGDIEARYSTNKGRLPPDMIEEMRAAYKRCESLMQTSAPELGSEETLKRAFKEQLLLVAGYKKEEVDDMDLDEMPDETVHNLVRQKLLGVMANNGSRQRLIRIDHVESYIAQGWEFVSALGTDKAIMKLPT